MIKLIGFDLDGTLINSVPDLTTAVNCALKRFNIEMIEEDKIRSFVGQGAKILLKRCLEYRGMEKHSDYFFDQINQNFAEFYAIHRCDKSYLYPQVEATLAKLHELGYCMAIVTNKPAIHVMPILQHLKIDKYFSLVLGGGDTLLKPHPAPIYYMLGKLGFRADETLFVGDSINDIRAAQDAGVASFGLTYGYSNIDLATIEPNYLSDNFSQILTILGHKD